MAVSRRTRCHRSAPYPVHTVAAGAVASTAANAPQQLPVGFVLRDDMRTVVEIVKYVLHEFSDHNESHLPTWVATLLHPHHRAKLASLWDENKESIWDPNQRSVYGLEHTETAKEKFVSATDAISEVVSSQNCLLAWFEVLRQKLRDTSRRFAEKTHGEEITMVSFWEAIRTHTKDNNLCNHATSMLMISYKILECTTRIKGEDLDYTGRLQAQLVAQEWKRKGELYECCC